MLTMLNYYNYNLLLLLIFAAALDLVGATKFDFETLTLSNLKLLGDAHLRNGSIHLSRDLPVPNSSAGRALYANPVRLRHPTTRAPLPFSTFFSFSVTNLNADSIGGGLAFLITSDDRAVGDAGGFLGLIDASATAASPEATVIAVEFDTVMDVEFDDINSNHVGVDIGSMVSAKVADLDAANIDLKSGDLIHVWLEYGGVADSQLNVFISYSDQRPAVPIVSYPIDLGRLIDDVMYVGFSGSTQGSTEIHCIEWWSFYSASPPSPSTPVNSTTPNAAASTSPSSIAPSISISAAAGSPANASVGTHITSSCENNSLCRQGRAAVAGVATAGAFVIAACAGVGVWAFAKRARIKDHWHNSASAAPAEIVNSPREFTYKELSAATRSFDSSRIIGHGAFGTVYKGIIPETGALIAVKRCVQSNNSAQARAEFLSEFSIIASLRHRNLVRLQGWCHEKGEILLVYDYMIHGSLDKALFDPRIPPLSWRHRRDILIGVASALAYLHRECDRQVIHRDVKSSNIMLDEGFHPRLGDFGLARQVEHDKSPDATVTAGTMGYLAPEYLLTGRATEKTDVFSFGTVALEVTSGRRPIATASDADATADASKKCSNLVDWVWTLHGAGRILEAADPRLGGEFDEGDMRRVMLVGLACSSPDPAARPGMRTVVLMLVGEAEPPLVPASRPSMSMSANHQLLLSLQDSVSDYNALGLNLSTSSSSSSSSLTSSLRGAFGGGGSSGAGGGG